MSRRVTETMPRRDEVPPFKRAQRRVAGRNWRPGKGKAGSGEKARQTSNPDLSFGSWRGSIEMPRQTETPEGASVAPVGGFAKRSVPANHPPPSPAHSAANTVAGLRSQEGSAKPSPPPPTGRRASLRSPLASKSLAPTTFWRWNGEDQEGSRP
ncbi:hypothetical protein EVAR_57748_1 [Eumeta japonica]|uniref:Uncharacterized protein n=1 Tax=Eumeta variegata TaxID=151549 RepID=A0A4C1ZR13_EUMVA|nr:hypothetical protein EVAR_57748_1 [Eumeta japonica]